MALASTLNTPPPGKIVQFSSSLLSFGPFLPVGLIAVKVRVEGSKDAICALLKPHMLAIY